MIEVSLLAIASAVQSPPDLEIVAEAGAGVLQIGEVFELRAALYQHPCIAGKSWQEDWMRISNSNGYSEAEGLIHFAFNDGSNLTNSVHLKSEDQAPHFYEEWTSVVSGVWDTKTRTWIEFLCHS